MKFTVTSYANNQPLEIRYFFKPLYGPNVLIPFEPTTLVTRRELSPLQRDQIRWELFNMMQRADIARSSEQKEK